MSPTADLTYERRWAFPPWVRQRNAENLILASRKPYRGDMRNHALDNKPTSWRDFVSIALHMSNRMRSPPQSTHITTSFVSPFATVPDNLEKATSGALHLTLNGRLTLGIVLLSVASHFAFHWRRAFRKACMDPVYGVWRHYGTVIQFPRLTEYEAAD